MVTMRVPADSEIGRLLREAEAAGEPLRIDTGEATYMVRREESERPHHHGEDEGMPKETDYDPEKARAAIRRAAGTLSDSEAEAMKRYIYEAREAGTRGLDRP